MPGIRILVVDDEPYVASFMVSVLEGSGHKADSVLNGVEAQARLEQADFDLVFSDLRMPEMNGEQLFEWMQTSKPDIHRIMVTGLPDIEPELEAMKARGLIHSYLIKPFRTLELIQAANRLDNS